MGPEAFAHATVAHYQLPPQVEDAAMPFRKKGALDRDFLVGFDPGRELKGCKCLADRRKIGGGCAHAVDPLIILLAAIAVSIPERKVRKVCS